MSMLGTVVKEQAELVADVVRSKLQVGDDVPAELAVDLEDAANVLLDASDAVGARSVGGAEQSR